MLIELLNESASRGNFIVTQVIETNYVLFSPTPSAISANETTRWIKKASATNELVEHRCCLWRASTLSSKFVT